MLFKSRFHESIRAGRITTTVRIWKRPQVRLGGRYTLGDGAVVVDRMHEIRLEDITPAIARRSGFTCVVDLLKTAKHGEGERVFVIDFHYDGSAPARPDDQPRDRLPPVREGRGADRDDEPFARRERGPYSMNGDFGP